MADKATGQTPPQQQELSAMAQEVLSKAGVPQSKAAEAPSQAKDQAVDEVTIDLGGVKRSVKVADLASIYAKQTELQEAEQVLKRRFAEASDLEALRQLKSTIETLPPDRMAKVMSLIKGGDTDEDVGVDDDLDVDPEPRRASDPDTKRQLVELRKGLEAMAAYLNRDIQGRQQATLREQVQGQMGQFPIFRDDPAAASFAIDSIMNQLALNPQQPIDKVVMGAAQKLTSLKQEAERRVVDSAVPGQRFEPPPFKGGADSLRNGDVRKAALAYLNSLPNG